MPSIKAKIPRDANNQMRFILEFLDVGGQIQHLTTPSHSTLSFFIATPAFNDALRCHSLSINTAIRIECS